MYNINPLLWGPHMWKSLHYITLAYPDNPDAETKQMYKKFFTDIHQFLPCEKCRFNYKRHLTELPLTDDILDSRNKFIFWLVDIHNIVNEETGKKKISYNEFNDIYINNKKESKKNKTSLYIILFLVITLIVLFMIYKKSYK